MSRICQTIEGIGILAKDEGENSQITFNKELLCTINPFLMSYKVVFKMVE